MSTDRTTPRPAGAPTVSLWSLREDVSVEPGAAGALVVRHGVWEEVVPCPDPVFREVLWRMTLGPVLLSNIDTRLGHPPVRARQLPYGGRADGTGQAWLTLRRLSHLVVRSLGVSDLGGPLLSVLALSSDCCFDPVWLPAGSLIRLSPSTTLRVEGDGLVLESVLAPYRVLLHRPEAVWVVRVLDTPISPAAAVALPAAPAATADIMAYLAAAGMTDPVDDDPAGG